MVSVIVFAAAALIVTFTVLLATPFAASRTWSEIVPATCPGSVAENAVVLTVAPLGRLRAEAPC